MAVSDAFLEARAATNAFLDNNYLYRFCGAANSIKGKRVGFAVDISFSRSIAASCKMAQEDGSGASGDAVRDLQLHFVERAACVPLVVGIADAVSRRYIGIKARSTILAAALATAENAAGAVVRRCLPVARAHLGPQLEYVDALACRGLNEIEKLCPAALRRPEEIVADAVDFGRQKAEAMQRCSREQAERIRGIVVAAARLAADRTAAILSSARDLINNSFNAVDEALDLWISVHLLEHEPFRNNVQATHTLRELALTTLQKLHTAVSLQLAYERDQFLRIVNSTYDYFHVALHNTPTTAQPATTVREHVIAAAQHTLLALSFLPAKARRVYAALYDSIAELHRFCTTLPVPIQDNASNSSQSSEESFDSQG